MSTCSRHVLQTPLPVVSPSRKAAESDCGGFRAGMEQAFVRSFDNTGLTRIFDVRTRYTAHSHAFQNGRLCETAHPETDRLVFVRPLTTYPSPRITGQEDLPSK